jgi:AcrR family transcriptional regulator
MALAREGGPDRVVLREAARAAGASHSASYRHFADRQELLAEVSRRARSELAAQMRRYLERADDPVSRLGAIGTAYIDFALAQPGLFRTAFGSYPAAGNDKRDSPAAHALHAGADRAEPYEILGEVLDQVQSAGLLEPSRRPGAAVAAWSAVHGLASLLLDGTLSAGPADIDFALRQVLDLIARGLLTAVPPDSRPTG